MELIYANHKREDVGILKNPDLDLAFGGDENNFECTVGIKDHCCEDGFYIYAEGTEYGGIVDAIKIDSADDTVTYSGRTWHGMLASKMIEPLKNGEETGGGGGGTASRLPEGYTEVEYIQSSGTQYINTGVTGKSGIKAECKYEILNSDFANTFLLGSVPSGWTPRCYLLYWETGVHSYGYIDHVCSSVSANVNQVYDVTVDLAVGAQSLTVNGNALLSGSNKSTFDTKLALYAFGANYNGTLHGAGSYRVYYMRLYDNGALVRDFVPCKNASGVAGLYDVVNGKFYGNAGSGSFAVGADVRVIVLPKGYKRREYIESTGTQYIDTGYKPNQDTRVVIDLQVSESHSGEGHLCSARSTSSGAFWILLYNNSKYTTRYGTQAGTALPITDRNRHVFDKNKNVTSVDGETVQNNYETFSVSANLPLLCRLTGTTTDAFLSAKLYSCQVYNNGTLIRDFVPCENDSGVIGLYDLVESKFYGNAGSGSFVGGTEIETPTVDEPAVVVVEAEDENGDSCVDKCLVISGDANFCVKYILDRVNLAPLFVAVEDAAGVNVEKHRFDPYLDAYTGLCEMLEKVGLRLQTECFDGVVTLSAVPIFDFSADQEMESDLIEYQMTKKYRKVNHLICIGYSGTVVHLYVDADGHISETQTFVGVEEYTAVNGQKSENEESASTGTDERADLIANGKKVLAGMLKANTITVQFEPTDDTYYVGDIVGAYDRTTDISVSARVNKKILSLTNGRAEIEYKVGD